MEIKRNYKLWHMIAAFGFGVVIMLGLLVAPVFGGQGLIMKATTAVNPGSCATQKQVDALSKALAKDYENLESHLGEQDNNLLGGLSGLSANLTNVNDNIIERVSTFERHMSERFDQNYRATTDNSIYLNSILHPYTGTLNYRLQDMEDRLSN